MKIKIINIKEITKYLIKFFFIFGIMAILINFFYSKKGGNNFFSFDSNAFLGALKEEILLLKQNNPLNIDIDKKSYFSNTMNNEFSMFKEVATSNNSINENDTNTKDDKNSSKSLENDKQPGLEETVSDNSAEQSVESNANLQEVPINVETQVLPSNIPDKTTYQVFGVNIRNESDYNIQNEIKDLNIEFNKNDIIIFHTHTCESYTPTEQFTYNSTGNYRTTDLNFSVARVGDELEKYLTKYVLTVIHDKS